MRQFATAQVTLALLFLCGPVTSAHAAWSIRPTPNPAGSPSPGFAAISCPALTCTAVGAYGTSNGPQPLAERWDGTSWSIANVLGRGAWGAALAGVSCVSDGACVAVGHWERPNASRTLVEGWDGRAWSIVPSPNPPGTSASYLDGVSCLPPGACVAVGYYVNGKGHRRAMIESWNGAQWSIRTAPQPSRSLESELLGVSCVSPNVCVAVGTYTGLQGKFRTLTERSTGGPWTVLPTLGHPNPVSRSLTAVSCVSAADCTAVGDYVSPIGYVRTLAEAWNGVGWTIMSVPNPGPFDFLNGVSCPSANSCLAVGQAGGDLQGDTPLAERWNGSTWAPESAAAPLGEASGSLNGVACRSAASCTAVGGYAKHNGDDLTLAEDGS
jgi:hypothetical protein